MIREGWGGGIGWRVCVCVGREGVGIGSLLNVEHGADHVDRFQSQRLWSFHLFVS